ncbi:hypothetical protein D1BOALGB6SA_8030 [Olavius sp. associated proteobacterium Delta 1]|nr:hypothetical protein D1BOALGB6SA_8030 [Olavius sp. associated proteobacterium Delta 1]
MKLIKRRLLEIKLPAKRSAFLRGSCKTGKTDWINRHSKDSVSIDLLRTDIFAPSSL